MRLESNVVAISNNYYATGQELTNNAAVQTSQLEDDRAEASAADEPSVVPSEEPSAASSSCVEGRIWALAAGKTRNPNGLPESCQADTAGCEMKCKQGVADCSSADAIQSRFKPVVVGAYTRGEHFRAAYDVEMHSNVTQVCRKVAGSWSWQNIGLNPKDPDKCGSYPSDPGLVDGEDRPECASGALCGIWHTNYCAP
ncbi:MAG: hypothetical protein IPJ88_14595 [Myxococcales bacterium]|nr:MAG: hypothetical protein IPJ88_14595 [Myxococcales bacterium]